MTEHSMTAFAIYVAAGIGFTVLLHRCVAPPKGKDWLWLPAMVLLWPMLLVLTIWIGSSDRGY